ncbi:MAG: transketolase [Desulfobacterales bacterium]|nr:transketolase [Desulfobacterales bacterium]
MISDIEIVKKLKREIIETMLPTGEGHLPSAFSIIDILWVLYDKILKIDSNNIEKDDRNHFILSKGHGSLALYAVLSEKDFFTKGELRKFARYDSRFGGHPDCNKLPGVEASTGSLGHGLPMALGMALGMKIRHMTYRVYTIVGDGECNEGSIWEAALLAAHHRLNNLVCIVDYNHSGDRALKLDDLSNKFSSFGWRVINIKGHLHEEILKALKVVDDHRPLAIIADTIKGFGIKMMENNPAWHHRGPTKEEAAKMLEDLQ